MSRADVKALVKGQRNSAKEYIYAKHTSQSEETKKKLYSKEKRCNYSKYTVKRFPEKLLKVAHNEANVHLPDDVVVQVWETEKKKFDKVHKRRNKIAKKLNLTKNQKKKLRKKKAQGRKKKAAGPA